MRRNVKTMTAVLSAATAVAGALVPSGLRAATTYVWTGTTGDFNNASFWNPAAVPGSAPATDIAAVSNGGTITISASDPLWLVNQLWAGDKSTGGAGNVLQTGGTLNTSSGGFLAVGHAGTTGTYNLAGGTVNVNGTVRLFGNTTVDATGVQTVMTVGSGALLNNTGAFQVGYANGTATAAATLVGSATLNINGGTINNGGNFEIGEGQGAVGTVVMNSGMLNNGTGQLWIGDSGDSSNHIGGSGVLTINGGTIVTHSWAAVGRGGSSTGVMNLNGGTFIHLAGNGDFEVGSYGDNNNTANTSTLNLNGGTLETDFIRDESPGGSSQIINFNGSVIQPNNSDGGFIGGHGNFTALNVLTGGVVFNLAAAASLDYNPPAQGYDVAITQTLIGSAGDGGVTVTGPGLLALTASNSYNGAIKVTNAILQVANDNGLGNNPSITLINNGTIQNDGDNGVSPNPSFVLSSSRSIVIVGSGNLRPGWQGFENDAPISGTGNFGVVFDSGILTLASSDSYTGSTTIGATGNSGFYDGGVYGGIVGFGLRLANNNALPSGTGLIFGVDPNNAAFVPLLDMNGYSTTVGTLSGTGVGAQIINTNVGSTSTLTIGSATGNSAGITASTVSTFAGSILDVAYNTSGYGTIALTKVGPGIQVMGGTLNYSGPTTISGGKFYVNGSLSTSTISLASGTTLGGSGVINTPVSIPSGAFLEGGYLGNGTLNTTAGATLAGGSNIVIGNLTMYPNAAGVPAINVSGGALALSGAVGVTVSSATGVLTVGSVYDLLNYSSKTGSGTFQVNGSLPDRAVGSITDTGSEVELTITAVDFLKWTGAQSTTWDTTTPNFKLNSTGAATTYINNPGDTVVFDDTASQFTVNVGNATLTPSSVTFNNSGHNYTVVGTGGISGLTGLTKLGTGALTLDSANSYTGATNVSAGTLQIGTGGSISPSSALILGNGSTGATLVLGDSTSPVSISVGNLTGMGSIIGGNTAVSTLTFPVNSNFSLGTFAIGGASAGATTANAVALVKTGSATLTIPNANNYTGGTTIAGAGTVAVGSSGALGTGAVTITTNSTLQALASVNLPNNFNLGSTADTFDTNGNTLTLSGAITNSFGTDVGVIRPVGTGTLVLSGTLNVGGGNNDTNNPAIYMASTGTTTTVTATGTINGISMGWTGSSNTLNLAPAGTLNITNTDPAIDVGQQGGNGAIIQTAGTVNASTGNLSLGKWDGSYGSYTITGGTLEIGAVLSGANGNGNGNSYFLQTGGTVNVSGYTTVGQNNAGVNTVLITGGTYNNTGNSFTLANGNGNTASLTVGGTGTLNAAAIVIGANNNNASVSTLNINSGGTVATTGISQRFASAIGIVNFNGGVLQANGSDEVFLNNVTAANIYSGGAIFNTAGQSVVVAQNLTSAAAGGSMGLNTAASVTSGGSGYISPPVVSIVGGGGTGATAVATVSGGVVTGVTITSPGTGYTSAPQFNFVGAAGSGAGATANPTANAADGGLIKQGLGTLTLSGVNSYTGNTVVQGGTLVAGSSTAFSSGTVVLNNTATLGLGRAPANVMSFSTASPNYYFTANTNGNGGFAPIVSSDGSSVQLTSALNSEGTSIFSSQTFPISDTTGFSASFTYRHAVTGGVNSAADGITFTLQNSTNNAYGLPGGDLAYVGSTAFANGSVAEGIDLYADQLETGINGTFNNPAGVTTTLNGASTNNPTGMSTVPLISQSGILQVDLTYSYNATTGGELRETLTNPANGSSVTYVTDGIDVASIVGGNAYIGFTAATGGVNDIQTISNFSFNNNSSAGTTYTTVAVANPITVSPSASSTIQLSRTANFSSGSVGPIMIGTAATLSLSIGTNPAAGVTHGVLTTPSVTFTSSTSGTLNVANDALDITGQSLATVTALAKSGYANGTWSGPGLSSSAATADSSHLTALGVIVNSTNGTTPLYGSGSALGMFEGISPAATDVLVKFTYYGDTNLDGKVDGSDYSRIDSTFQAEKTSGSISGWYNGDFNYDGVVNGSDYTLMDNAFNQQGVSLAASVAAQVSGTSAVPEPATLSLIAIGAAGLLGRRRRHN